MATFDAQHSVAVFVFRFVTIGPFFFKVIAKQIFDLEI